MTILSQYQNCTAYVTKDGSTIREIMHPTVHGNQNQSLAEAVIEPGQLTQKHKHIKSEEIYYILQGEGNMRLGENSFMVSTGDCICIPPGTQHQIKNTGITELKILCCCSPAYAHDDTQLIK